MQVTKKTLNNTALSKFVLQELAADNHLDAEASAAVTHESCKCSASGGGGSASGGCSSASGGGGSASGGAAPPPSLPPTPLPLGTLSLLLVVAGPLSRRGRSSGAPTASARAERQRPHSSCAL